MSVITSDFLAGVLTNFRALFHTDFDAALAGEAWRELATVVPSTTRTESYSWLGSVPKMQDVTRGDLILDELGNFSFSIENKVWKAGFEVERQEFEDDKLGLIRPRINDLAREGARHPAELVFGLLEDNPAAYDGVALFANTRVIGGSANIDNLLAGTGITVAAFKVDLATARGVLSRFQDDKGRPMGNRANVIITPPELTGVAWEALNASQTPGAGTPVMPASENGVVQGAGFTIVENPYATDATDWYLATRRPGRNPFIFQEREAVTLEGLTTPESETAIIRDRYVYASRGRYNVGVGEPRHIVKIVNS